LIIDQQQEGYGGAAKIQVLPQNAIPLTTVVKDKVFPHYKIYEKNCRGRKQI
jgi:hypothetical protein